MDKWQGLHSFWSGFEIPAYDEASVPDEATMPYITYTAAVDSLDSAVALSANLWYRSTSWEEISKKADEIYQTVQNGGVRVPLDAGYLWVVAGSPFAQRVTEEVDTVKHIYIALVGEFQTP